MDALRFLAATIGGAKETASMDACALARFYATAGLPSTPLSVGRHPKDQPLYTPLNAPARTSRERFLAAAFLRAAVDLAAAAQARHAAAVPGVDIDEYGVFTAEDDIADKHLSQLIRLRSQLFPAASAAPKSNAPASKRARAPLASRDPNRTTRVVVKPHPRKQQLPRAATFPARSASRPAARANKRSVPRLPTPLELARAARQRAEEAVAAAQRAGVHIEEVHQGEALDSHANDAQEPVVPEKIMHTQATENDPAQVAATNAQATVDALIAESERAAKAVHRFKTMVTPLLADSHSKCASAENDASLDAQLAPSTLAAYDAQQRLLAEIRARASMRISYRALEMWVAALPKEPPAATYCRQRSETALRFISAIETEGNQT